MTGQRRAAAAVALLIASTAALAWLPAFAASPSPAGGEVRLDSSARPLYLAGCAVAGAAFLALARRAWRTRHEPSPRHAVRAIWLVAIALRIPALLAAPWLSDDVWRCLWEGEVQRQGHSPFAHAPDSAELAGLDEALRARVAHPSIPAVYPPAAQLLFRVAARGLHGWKLLLVAADMAIVALLLRRLARCGLPRARALLYAWHPLVVLEFCASAHVDVAALLLLVAALAGAGRTRVGELLRGACAGLGGMVKPQAFVALAGFALQRRFAALAAAVVAALLVTLPFAGDGPRLFDGVRRYAHDWEFNGLIHPTMVRVAERLKGLLEGLPDQPLHLWAVRELGYPIVPNQLGRKLSLLLFAALAWWSARRWRDRPALLALALLVAFLATAPAVHPWYAAWIVPFLPLLPHRAGRALLLLTITTLAAGAVKVQSLATGIWEEPAWVALATWLPPCVVGAFDLWRAPAAGAAPPPAGGGISAG